jgi:SAM-dependent methyltransferase
VTSWADPTRRFSTRVDDYVRYRPHYPPEIIPLLTRECGLGATSVVADIGSGTGILSELFLLNGCRVLGVEPNREMREAGERLLRGYATFVSIAGTAEATTLPAASVEFVTAGQAFHWFDGPLARAEFARILVPGGRVVLVWNTRRKKGSPFSEAYEALLQRWSIDYAEADHERITDEMIAAFYAPATVVKRSFPNSQKLGLEGARGRLESSSYVPAPGHPDHESILAELRIVFDRTNRGGMVIFEYDTVLYYGRLER